MIYEKVKHNGKTVPLQQVSNDSYILKDVTTSIIEYAQAQNQ